MNFDMEQFFKAIDFDDHFNARTKEAYWDYFLDKCDRNIDTLYDKGKALYPEKEGLHQYVQLSIKKFLDYESRDDIPADKPQQVGDSKISPIDKKWKKKPASSWGYNNDVKLK